MEFDELEASTRKGELGAATLGRCSILFGLDQPQLKPGMLVSKGASDDTATGE
jgi:hypothetical protein